MAVLRHRCPEAELCRILFASLSLCVIALPASTELPQFSISSTFHAAYINLWVVEKKYVWIFLQKAVKSKCKIDRFLTEKFTLHVIRYALVIYKS